MASNKSPPCTKFHHFTWIIFTYERVSSWILTSCQTHSVTSGWTHSKLSHQFKTQITSQKLDHSSGHNTVNSKWNPLKTVHNKHISTFQFRSTTTDKISHIPQATCSVFIQWRTEIFKITHTSDSLLRHTVSCFGAYCSVFRRHLTWKPASIHCDNGQGDLFCSTGQHGKLH